MQVSVLTIDTNLASSFFMQQVGDMETWGQLDQARLAVFFPTR